MGKILSRIQEIADKKAITITALETKLGASKGVLSRALRNDTDIQSKWLQIIVENYPDISPSWLLTGEGPMLKADSDGEVKVSKAEPSADGLPLVPIEAVAGFNGDDMPGVRLEDCLRYVVPEFAAAGAEYLIRVSGSSMYPKYSSGDILACRRIPEIDFFQWGKIYVIDSSQGAMVKRIYQCEDDAACVLCKSDNDKYPPFTLPKSAIRSLSIVIGVIRLE
ncbi:MAG: helix-turn-helix transcriptional regulator [Paludibacteraceae bacterium]|nr:helix-turn-helix transcriptional regulator [Paludibacteraceae bacterium]